MTEKKQQHAYQRLLAYLKQSAHEFEKKSLHELMLDAKIQLIQLEQLTEDELDTAATYLKRDLYDATDFMQRTGKALADWLVLDLNLIEDKFWQAFLSVADKTLVERLKFNLNTGHEPNYKSGEMIGLGVLKCKQCAEQLEFHEVSQIPLCPKCKHNQFVRVRTPLS